MGYHALVKYTLEILNVLTRVNKFGAHWCSAATPDAAAGSGVANGVAEREVSTYFHRREGVVIDGKLV